MRTAVYIKVSKTNRDRIGLADTARRQANYLGPQGFIAMKGQSDQHFRKHDFLRLEFPTRSLAIRFQDRFDENCDPLVTTKRFKVP